MQKTRKLKLKGLKPKKSKLVNKKTFFLLYINNLIKFISQNKKEKYFKKNKNKKTLF